MTVSRRTFLSGVVAAPLVPSISADEERIALHRADTGEATWAEMADTWDGLIDARGADPAAIERLEKAIRETVGPRD